MHRALISNLVTAPLWSALHPAALPVAVNGSKEAKIVHSPSSTLLHARSAEPAPHTGNALAILGILAPCSVQSGLPQVSRVTESRYIIVYTNGIQIMVCIYYSIF